MKQDQGQSKVNSKLPKKNTSRKIKAPILKIFDKKPSESPYKVNQIWLKETTSKKKIPHALKSIVKKTTQSQSPILSLLQKQIIENKSASDDKTSIPKQHHFNKACQSEIRMNALALYSHRIKNLKGNVLKFSEDRSRLTKEIVKLQVKTIRSPNHIQNLELSILHCNFAKNDAWSCLIQSIRTFTSLKEITLKFQLFYESKITDHHVEHLGESFRRLKYLESITLEFFNCHGLSDDAILRLCKKLKNLASLKKLSVILSSKFTEDGYRKLGKILQKIPSLQDLRLDHNDPTDLGVINLSQGFRKLQSLKQINLDFTKCSKLSDIMVDVLSQNLIELKSLESLKLSFGYPQQLTNVGIIKLSRNLSSLDSCLKNLSLNFSRSQSITHIGLCELGKALKTLVSLEYLDLQLQRCDQIEDLDIDMKEALSPLQALKTIQLNLSRCKNLTDIFLLNLVEGFQPLASLNSLSLMLDDCPKITDIGVNELLLVLSSLIGLRKVSLNFAGCGISILMLDAIGQNLTQFESLRALSLFFSQEILERCQLPELLPGLSINTEKALWRFIENFKTITSLEHITLSFSRCHGITTSVFQTICEGLKQLTSLQSLSLHFANCMKFNSSGFVSLAESLKSLTALHTLHLNFSNCLQIPDLGLKNLSHGISYLRSLRNLTLQFPYCDKITSFGIIQLAQDLKGLTHLRNAEIDCIRCVRISMESAEKLYKVFQKRIYLQKCYFDWNTFG